MARRRTRLKLNPSGYVNGVFVENLIDWCNARIKESREYKNSLVPNLPGSGRASSYANFLSELEEWETGDRRLPDKIAITGGTNEATNENIIWKTNDTIRAMIDEKDYDINHVPEGPEDSDSLASTIAAVRSYEWRMDKCSDVIRSMMKEASRYGTAFAAVHASKFISPSSLTGTRIIRPNILSIHWNKDAGSLDNARWLNYSDLLLAGEIEGEFGVRVPEEELEKSMSHEDEYNLIAFKSKKPNISERQKNAAANKDTGEPLGRVQYFWIYDVTVSEKRDPILERRKEKIREEVVLPAMDADGNMMNPADLGLPEDSELIEEPEQKYYKGMVDTGIEEEAYFPKIDPDTGLGAVNVEYIREYPRGRLIVYCGDALLYDGVNPYKMEFLRKRADQRYFPIPVFWIHANELPNRALALSHTEIILDDQIAININVNQIRLSNQKTGNSPTILEQGNLVHPVDPSDLDFNNNSVIIVKKIDGLKNMTQPGLPQQAYAEKNAKISIAEDKIGLNPVLVRGMTNASDPAQKTEFLTNMAMRRSAPFLRSTHNAVVKWEEIRLSLDRQFISTQFNVPVSKGKNKQNVDFNGEMLNNYHAQISMQVIDSTDTRRAKKLASLSRFGEQANVLISAIPGGAQAFVETILELSDVPEFKDKLDQYKNQAMNAAPAPGAIPPQGGAGTVDNMQPVPQITSPLVGSQQ